jgi:hypothetical protein
MNRPTVEVADIFRSHGDAFIDRHSLGIPQLKAIQAIRRCRTAALGGHVDVCPQCGGDPLISYNSCRNRHCNKCQSQARDRWIEARKQELLDTRYFHVVSTLPHDLHGLVLQNQAELYDLLFRTVAETLRQVARDPKHLGVEIGFFGILHTWGQNLLFHPHIHCVIPGGGISPDKTQWIHAKDAFFLPVKVLSKVFRGKFVAGLRRAHRKQRLTCVGSIQYLKDEKRFSAFLRTIFRQNWVVYAKPAFGGPDPGDPLPGPLHSPRRHFESPARLARRRSGHVSLAGLRPWQQATAHDRVGRRIHAAFPVTRSAKRLRPHPSLRTHG